jgi:hypothetical protein
MASTQEREEKMTKSSRNDKSSDEIKESIMKKTRRSPVRESLARLIEDVMEKSEVVLAAQSIVDKLQGIAEDLSTVEAKEIMPLLDSLASAFGPQVSDQFNQVATEQIRNLITAVQGSKTAIDGEILRMKKGVEGGDMSDMGMDQAAPPESMDDLEGMTGVDDDGTGEGNVDAQGQGLPEAPPDTQGNADDDMEMAGGFAGRERKMENAKRRGKKLSERMDEPHQQTLRGSGWTMDADYGQSSVWKNPRHKGTVSVRPTDRFVAGHENAPTWQHVDDNGRVVNSGTGHDSLGQHIKMENAKRRGKKLTENGVQEDFIEPATRPSAPPPAIDKHPHKSTYFPGNMSNLGQFHGRAGELGKRIEAMIDNDPLSGNDKKSLANVLSYIGSVAHDPAHWGEADQKMTMALQASNIYDEKHDPYVHKIARELRKLAHLLVLKHEGLVETSIQSLRSSTDPDALIFTTFRRKLAEVQDAQMAAIRTARTFAIDIEDVAKVVREGFADFIKKKKEEKKAKKPTKAKESTKPKGHVLESPELLHDAPMFPVQVGNPSSNNTPDPSISNPGPTGTTTAVTSNGTRAVGPTTTPPTSMAGPSTGGTNKPVPPMTPADKRQQQTTQNSQGQGQAATSTPTPPTGGQTWVPPNEGEQGVTAAPSAQPKMAPVQQPKRSGQPIRPNQNQFQ